MIIRATIQNFCLMEIQQFLATAYQVFMILNDLNQNFMEEKLLLSKSNSQKKESLCSFSKHFYVWK